MESLLGWLGEFLSAQTGLPTTIKGCTQLADGVALCDACKALSGASVGTVWRACPTPACCMQNATLAVRCIREKLAFPGTLEPQGLLHFHDAHIDMLKNDHVSAHMQISWAATRKSSLPFSRTSEILPSNKAKLGTHLTALQHWHHQHNHNKHSTQRPATVPRFN